VKGGLVLHSVSVPVWSSFSCEITQIKKKHHIQKNIVVCRAFEESCRRSSSAICTICGRPDNDWGLDAQRLVTRPALQKDFLALHNSDGPTQGIDHWQHLQHHATTSAINTQKCLCKVPPPHRCHLGSHCIVTNNRGPKRNMGRH